ncbi:MAG: TIGR02285 family protein [bacterium]
MNLLLLFLFLFSSSLLSDEIIWARQDFPPAYLQNGQGYIDKYLKTIQYELPEYKHTYFDANFARTIESMKKGEKVCSLAMLKNEERERHLHYSIPYLVIPANSIIVLKNKVIPKEIFESGSINLHKFLAADNRVGVARGRSYGSTLDKLLSLPSGKITIRGGRNVFEGLFGMLVRERLDAILGYRMELHWFSKEIASKLVSYQISGESNYIMGYATCPKNDWGKKVIVKLNKALEKHRVNPKFYGVYFKYLTFLTSQEYELEIKKNFNP